MRIKSNQQISPLNVFWLKIKLENTFIYLF